MCCFPTTGTSSVGVVRRGQRCLPLIIWGILELPWLTVSVRHPILDHLVTLVLIWPFFRVPVLTQLRCDSPMTLGLTGPTVSWCDPLRSSWCLHLPDDGSFFEPLIPSSMVKIESYLDSVPGRVWSLSVDSRRLSPVFHKSRLCSSFETFLFN